MPTSKRQIKSNRQNAQKSTGPKSMEGKEISSHNATRHGLYSRELIIQSPNLTEDPEEFERLHESLIFELMPNTQFQEFLVLKIALCIWRSRRALRAEAADVTNQVDDVDDEYQFRRDHQLLSHKPNGAEIWKYRTPEDVKRIRALEIDRQTIPDPGQDSTIIRYQMRIDRQMTRAYSLLDRLQRRQGRDIANPKERIEVPVSIYRCPMANGGQCRRESDSAESAQESAATFHPIPNLGAPPLLVGSNADDTSAPVALPPNQDPVMSSEAKHLDTITDKTLRSAQGDRLGVRTDTHKQKHVRIEPSSRQPHDIHPTARNNSGVLEATE